MLEGVPSEYPIEVVWEGGQRFRGGKPDVPGLLVDGERRAAPSPVDAMLVALASCSAIDVVEILEKRRTPARALGVTVEFSRAAKAPRRLTQARLLFTVRADSDARHVERAVELSISKYCSVASSLAPDVDLSWSVVVSPAGPGQTKT